jgi:uncharacterized protein YbjQ (UPF0145 family)
VNVALTGITRMLNESRMQVLGFLAWVSKLPIPGVNILAGAAAGGLAGAGELQAKQFDNPYAGTAGAVITTSQSMMEDALAYDYVGQSIEFVQGAASGAAEALRGLADSIGVDEKASKAAAKEAARQAEAYRDLTREARQFIADQELAARALGMTEEAANRLRYEQDMLNKAANDNIKLTPKMREEIGGLAQAMAAAEEATRRLTEIYSFGKDVFTGFFGDLKSGITEGKSLWESLGNAATNALDKIADKALSMAANGIFDMIFGSIMGGLTGGMGNSLGGGWGVAGGFGKPGIFGIPGFADGTNYAPGGMAWVGERGPELVNLPRGAQVIPNGPSMALAANGNGSNDNRRGDVHVQINGSGLSQAEMQAAIADALDYYDRKTLPSRVNDLKNDSLVVNG